MDRVKMMIEYPLDVPEEIVDYILNGDNKKFTSLMGNSYICYLQIIEDEIMLRAFAFRKYVNEGIRYTEVFRRITGDKTLIFKNADLHWIAGWQIDYWNNSSSWCVAPDDSDWFRGWYRVLNLDILKETRFKYCAYPDRGDLMKYLEIYDEDPRVEIFGKLKIFPERSLVKKAEKDRRFCSFLAENVTQVHNYGSKATIYAYNHGLDISAASKLLLKRRRFFSHVPAIRSTCIDPERAMRYIERHNISQWNYNDYLIAVKGLQLDLSDTKNAFPKDFRRMHDIRTREYGSLLEKIDREKAKKFNEKFGRVAKKYEEIEWSNEGYVIIIPKDISELKRESKVLHHCVGHMGYDKKMVDQISLILFLRLADKPNDPLYTIEFSLKKKCVIQSHGLKNCALDETAKKILDNWEQMAKLKLAAKKEA